MVLAKRDVMLIRLVRVSQDLLFLLIFRSLPPPSGSSFPKLSTCPNSLPHLLPPSVPLPPLRRRDLVTAEQ